MKKDVLSRDDNDMMNYDRSFIPEAYYAEGENKYNEPSDDDDEEEQDDDDYTQNEQELSAGSKKKRKKRSILDDTRTEILAYYNRINKKANIDLTNTKYKKVQVQQRARSLRLVMVRA